MAVFEPVGYDLSVLVGQTLAVQWNVFQDDGFLTAWDLTGYTFEAILEIPNLGENPAVTLTSGSGLNIVTNPGSIALSTPTTGWPVGRGRWYLQATDPSGEVSFPMRGKLIVGNP